MFMVYVRGLISMILVIIFGTISSTLNTIAFAFTYIGKGVLWLMYRVLELIMRDDWHDVEAITNWSWREAYNNVIDATYPNPIEEDEES